MSCLIYNLQGFIHFSNSQRIVLYCHHNACLFNAWVSKTISSKDTYKRINCNEIRVKYMIDIRQILLAHIFILSYITYPSIFDMEHVV